MASFCQHGDESVSVRVAIFLRSPVAAELWGNTPQSFSFPSVPPVQSGDGQGVLFAPNADLFTQLSRPVPSLNERIDPGTGRPSTSQSATRGPALKVLAAACLGAYLHLGDMKLWEARENYITRSILICTVHYVLFIMSNSRKMR